MQKTKSILIAFLLIVSGFMLFLKPAKATVPVDVIRGVLDLVRNVQNVETLQLLKDIDDTDLTPDLQSYIFGELYPDIMGDRGNVGVSRTQKFTETGVPGLKNIEGTLDAILLNIGRRIEEVEFQDREVQLTCSPCIVNGLSKSCNFNYTPSASACEPPDQITGQKRNDMRLECQNTVSELERLARRVCDYKAAARNTTALDVHIVKDTTDTLEELKNIAREQVAREQIGELASQLMTAYDAAGIKYFPEETDNPTGKSSRITNYKDYLFKEPIDRAKNYLDNKHFAVNNSVLPQDEMDAIKNAVKQSLGGDYRNPNIKPEKTLAVDIDDVFDPEKGGGWDQWLLLLEPNNNPYGIYFNALSSAYEVAEEAYEENKAINTAGQGSMPLTQIVRDGNGNPVLEVDASQKYEITEAAGVVKEYPVVVAQGQMTLAADPKTASVEKKTLATPDFALPAPVKDVVTSELGKIGNVEWQIETFNSAVQAMADIITACLPDIPSFCDIFPDLCAIAIPPIPVPSGLEICGQFFDFCSYFPDVCNFSSLPQQILDALETAIGNAAGNIWQDIFGNIF